MKNFLQILRKSYGIGLVEALIALAVIGTGMIIITSLSLRTVHKARENELQDVAVQAAVEAMDIMKMPGVLQINHKGSEQASQLHHYIRLQGASLDKLYIVDEDSVESEISEESFAPQYKNESLQEQGYEVYQQVYIRSLDSSSQKFELQSIVVWCTVGGGYKKVVIDGYRYGEVEMI